MFKFGTKVECPKSLKMFEPDLTWGCQVRLNLNLLKQNLTWPEDSGQVFFGFPPVLANYSLEEKAEGLWFLVLEILLILCTSATHSFKRSYKISILPDYKPPSILKDFLNEWVAEGEAYDPRDFTIYQKSPAGFDTKWYSETCVAFVVGDSHRMQTMCINIHPLRGL